MIVDYIIGKGAFVREVIWILRKQGIAHELKGVLQDDPDGSFIDEFPIVDAQDFYLQSFRGVAAIGSPSLREKIVQAYDKVQWTSVVDPTAQIGYKVKVGYGSIICANSILTCDINIGNHCQLNLATTIGHDSVLGDFVTTAPGVHINGLNRISSFVYFGSNSATREKIEVAKGVTVGMGSNVIKSVKEKHVTVVGNPAKVVVR